MEILSKIWEYAIIPGALMGILKLITLLKKSRIERLFLSEENKILVHILRFLIMTCLISIIFLQIIEWTSGQRLVDVKKDEIYDVMLQIGILSSLTSIIIYSYIPVLSMINGKKRNFYINNEKYGKLYILKISSKDQVILSDKPFIDAEDGMIIFENKEIINSTPIFCEVIKNSIASDIKMIMEKRRQKKALRNANNNQIHN